MKGGLLAGAHGDGAATTTSESSSSRAKLQFTQQKPRKFTKQDVFANFTVERRLENLQTEETDADAVRHKFFDTEISPRNHSASSFSLDNDGDDEVTVKEKSD